MIRIVILSILLILFILSILSTLCLCDFFAKEPYRGRGHSRASKREEKRQDDLALSQEEIRTIEREVASQTSVGGNFNCAVCSPCMDAVKACHSQCKSCSDFCGTRRCERKLAALRQHPNVGNRVLNSYTDQNLRQEGDPADHGKKYDADNAFV